MTRRYLNDLLKRYRTRGILVDANLLLLYVVGTHDERLITSFKRTRQFTPEDYRLLASIVGYFERIVTTPHVLTEVNGLSNQLPGRLRFDFYGTFGSGLREWTEQLFPSTEAVENMAFRYLGLTDAAIAEVARGDVLVLSVDLDLITHLHKTGRDAINFNNIRPLGWSI